MSTTQSHEPTCPPHDTEPRPTDWRVPENACDVHAHVCGPERRYPYVAERLYTPPDVSVEEFLAMLDALGIERGVLVQPSIYGTDNSALVDALARSPQRLRGVAVVPFDASIADIEVLHQAGVRGVRCNIVDLKHGKGRLPLESLTSLGERIRPFGWHVEFLMHVDEFPDLDRQLGNFPVEMVFGHLGYVSTGRGTKTAGFRGLQRLMKDGKAWAKLTAPYRLTLSSMPYPDVDPFALELLEAAPDRLLWGSDWPHVYIRSAMPNDGDLLRLFGNWVRDQRLRKTILVDNPAVLYQWQ